MTAVQPPIESFSPSSSAEFQLVLLPPGFAGPHLRSEIDRHLAKPIAMTKGKIRIDDVMDMHNSGMAQLWMCVENEKTVGCIVTEIAHYVSDRKVLRVILGGTEVGTTWNGNLETAMTTMESFAVVEGCSSIVVDGRRGWGRVLKDYNEISSTFEKELI